MLDLRGVRLLREEEINPGDRWLYISDFNENPTKKQEDKEEKYRRVDSEVEDMLYILNRGGIVAILAHRGRYPKAKNLSLDFLVPYLSRKLERKVNYYRENVGEQAREFVKDLMPGEVALLRNTRQHEGEEKNDLELAREFAKLGEKVAVGGFGKAHRKNASNYLLLDFLPGYLTESQVREMEILEPWAGRQENSLAVLGGVKKEKITLGLEGLVRNYDYVIPGGIVLNSILKARGYDIGDSVIEDSGKTFEGEVREIMSSPYSSRVLIPERILIARKTDTGYSDIKLIRAGEAVEEGYMIAGYLLSREARHILEEIVSSDGKMVIAGTPDLYKDGLGLATIEIIGYFNRVGERGLVLGGDTASELKYDKRKYGGEVSSGGGSSLYFLVHNTTPVLEKLRSQAV